MADEIIYAYQPNAFQTGSFLNATSARAFVDALARDSAIRCVLVEMDFVAESSDSPTGPSTDTLYFSDREFFDDVTNHPYVDVVHAAPQYSRSLSGDNLGSYTSSIETLELDNADGQLDFMLSLACDGSEIRYYLGNVDWPVSEFKHIFTAITSKVTAPSFDRISVVLKDTGLLLNKSIGGTTTVGGSGPNADRARPLNIGYIHNLAALVANQALLIYVHSDTGSGTAAPEARDRGVSVSFTDNADGTFTLLATPDGIVTCDVLAEPLGADNVTVSDVVEYLVGDRAGLSALGLYSGPGPTWTVHDDDDYKLGVSLPEARNVIDVLSDVLNVSGNGFWAILRLGSFSFGRLRLNDIASFGLAERAVYEDDIDNGSFKLDHAPTQYYKYQAYMSRNWVHQTDFASSLNPDDQAVYSRPGLFVVQPDSVGTTYANAPELYHKTLTVSPVIDTLLSQVFSISDVDSLAQWETTRRAMFLPWIEVVTIIVGIDFYEVELGDPVRLLIAPRMGEDDNGVLFQAIGITIRLTDAKVELRLARRNVVQAVPASWKQDVPLIEDTQLPYAFQRRPVIVPIDISVPAIVDRVGSGGSGWGNYDFSYRSGGGFVTARSIVYNGMEIVLSNFGSYNHVAGSGVGALLANGVNLAETGFSAGGYTGVSYSGSTNGSSPLSIDIFGHAPSSITTKTHTETFVYITEVGGQTDFDFTVALTAPSAGVTSTLAFQVQFRDNTSSTNALLWLPAGNSIATTGTAVLDPFSLNGTVTTTQTGHFQCESIILTAGHSYTLSVTISVTNTVP